MNLQMLIDKEAFIACPLVDASTLQKFCQDRGIVVSRARLEAFERIGLIHPFLRMDVSGGRPAFWTRDVLKAMQQDGRVWFPSERPFAVWSTFLESDGRTKIESFYSTFQCIQVEEAIQRLSLQVWCEDACAMSEADLQKWGQTIVDSVKQIAAAPTLGPTISKVPIVCQLLANRYFFQTQSDRRTIQISQPFRPDKWDWSDYAREWKAEQELKDLGVAPEILVQTHDTIKSRARCVDPLERWYSLVSFVNVDKRKRLRNTALYAQTLYSMEAMLRMFLDQATGTKIAAPDESKPGDQDSFYGVGVTQNELEYLTYLTNQYHLNPKPRLLLFVEGSGEFEIIPRLFEHIFAAPMPRFGIEINNLEGVGNFTGDKRQDKFGALEKLIDIHHRNQTIVFCLLDKEGRVETIKKKLVTAQSKFVPARTVIKDELIHLWNTSVEFDNFSDAEIATVMGSTVGNGVTFTAEEVAECRKSGKTLNALCREKTGDALPKVENLITLFERFVFPEDPSTSKRPIVEVLKTIANLAALNHQPVTADIKRANQNSGYFANKP